MAEYREEKDSHTLVFRNKRSHCKRENATEVRVKGHAYTDDIWWPWPESEPTIKMIVQVADGAFGAGRRDAQLDMRLALGLATDDETGFFRTGGY